MQCRQDLDWYVEIKKIQGSVEVTSINQVEDIYSYGAYTISCNEQKASQSIERAVLLKISRVKAAKKEYSFNDLRDLESKLVLIRGRSTKGAAEMDRFLNVSFRIFVIKLCLIIFRFFTWYAELQKLCLSYNMQDIRSTFHGL